MKVLFIIITLITFFIFFIEGLIHYNTGIKSKKCIGQEYNQEIKFNFFGHKINIPEKKDILLMCFTILVFSSITGLLTAYIIKHHLNAKDK